MARCLGMAGIQDTHHGKWPGFGVGFAFGMELASAAATFWVEAGGE